ncbi:hypothetical protein HID58_075237, partial [Brassica napus]
EPFYEEESYQEIEDDHVQAKLVSRACVARLSDMLKENAENGERKMQENTKQEKLLKSWRFKFRGVMETIKHVYEDAVRVLEILQAVRNGLQFDLMSFEASKENVFWTLASGVLKALSLPGKLPPELANLRYLQSIDLCRNYLSGTIPMEWASLPNLTSISLCANNFSGTLPTGLQNFKNLTFLSLEANQFFGTIPDELGNLTNLNGLQLGSNQFNGSLPSTLARLLLHEVHQEDNRVSDNNFQGTIPEYIGKWSQLEKLHLYASGLKGPMPEEVALLENLTDLRISDTTGINAVPILSSKDIIKTLILRNVGLSGSIPPYIWNLK